MDIRFAGKKALVTGAGRGIGRDVAKALAQGGAQVFALSKTQANLDSLKQEVPAIIPVTVNLADWMATRKAVQQLGHIDLLVNNAGVIRLKPFIDISQEDYDFHMDVNIKAAFNVSQVVVKGMIEKGHGGAIVNISSAAAKVGVPGFSVYCPSKGALDQLTRSLAVELGPHQIRVNSVNPSLVLTDMGRGIYTEDMQKMCATYPLQKLAEVSDVVNAVMFLLSDQASMVTGSTLPVDAGFLVT